MSRELAAVEQSRRSTFRSGEARVEGAGDANVPFVTAYNPVAAGLGRRANWAYTDF